MEDEILSKDARLDDEDGMKSARDFLNTMSSYRIDPSRIRIPETEPGKRSGRSVVLMGEFAPAVESTAPKSSHTVAVKTIEWWHEDAEQSNRVFKSFAYELGLITTLSHPNIAKLVGFVEDIQERDARLILPWEGNGNVRDFLRSGEWDIPERISLIQDTASGLEYLHTRQPPIRHGDLKSMHILVSSSYRAMITGFWSARIIPNVWKRNKDDHWLQSLYELGISLDDSLYTLRWAAPELLNDESAGLPADMWALGWVCWEVVTDRIPFEDVQGGMLVVIRIMRGDLPAIWEDPLLCQVPQLCYLMSSCWIMDPVQRMDVSTFQKKAHFVPSTIPSVNTSGGPKVRPATLLLGLGRMYGLQNNTVAAESHYRSALEIATRNGNETDRANALIGLGDSHNTRSMYSEAEVAFLEAHEIYSRIGNQRGAADALNGRGEVYKDQLRYREAEKAFIEAHEIYSRIGIDRGVADASTGLGNAYSDRSRYREAEKAFVEAHEIYSRIGHDRGTAAALAGLGEVYGNISRYREAEDAFTEAHALHSRIGNEPEAANALTGVGRILNTPFRYPEAEKAFRQAHEIHSRIGNERGAANALIGLGEAYGVQSRYQMAEDTLLEACEIHSRIGNDHGVANASISLGRIFNVRSKYFDAEKAFRQAYELHSRIGNDYEAANALIGLGQVNAAQSRYREAERALLKALGIHSHIGDERGVADALIGLGELYGDQSRYREAEGALVEAEKAYSRIGNVMGAAKAVIGLGEICDSQSRHLAAEETFNEARGILSVVDDDLRATGVPGFLAENDEAQSTASEGEEYEAHSTASEGEEDFKGVSEIDSRTRMESRTRTKLHSLQEEAEEQPQENFSSTVDNLQQANFILELASIESISMPSTQYIIDLIIALAKTAPTATRNKHQLYRVLIISRDLCHHLHRLAHTGSDSSSGIDVLEQCWEIVDNLERILLELFDTLSQEMVPFGALSLATWNTSRTRLHRIYGELTAPPFNTCSIDDSANAIWDQYFDDCSWLSLLLLEGIEIPVLGMHSGTDDESVFIEARNVIERLNHLVNEAKLNGKTNEPARELFIKILSDLADVVMNGPVNLSADFWNTAEGALQDIDLEKGLNQDVVESLRDSWGRFANRQIQQIPAPRAPTPTPSQDSMAVSLPQELSRLDHKITPATEPLVLLLQSLGRGAPAARRHKHKIYAIVSRTRDICNHILTIGARPEVGGPDTLDEYYNLIDSIERILLDVARLLPAEQVPFGREMCVSWSESREELCKILNRLYEPPFLLGLPAPKQELTNNSVFDDHYWLSLLMEDGIEKELARQHLGIEMPQAVVSVREGLRYLENEIRCGYHEETAREIVIDIAIRLYEALSASVSGKGTDAEPPIRSAEPPPPITLDKNTLVTALSIAFSVLDLDSSLESRDIHRLAGNWWGIVHSSPTRHSGNPGERKLAETGLSSQVKPVGQEDQETLPDPTKSQTYWLQLSTIISRRNLAYSEEMVPRDKVRDENWIVTIHITGEDVDTLRLTGAGFSIREAKDAVARLALIVFGEIVGEE